MKALYRKISLTKTISDEENYSKSQASLNSDGNITLRNYDSGNKNEDKIIILSDRETRAIFELFSRIGQTNKRYDLPF